MLLNKRVNGKVSTFSGTYSSFAQRNVVMPTTWFAPADGMDER